MSLHFLKVNTFENNAGVPQGSLFSPTVFLKYISNLPKCIIGSPVNIYADDTTVYESITKHLDDQKLAADLPNPSLKAL